MKASAKVYNAALYYRLSKDDEGDDESSSIKTQRKMIRAYAKENGFIIYDEYIDDGCSGTNFDRPDFQRMIRDIEAGHINMVITKDLSRLGRDHITAGQYTELYFPEHNVRYIAINDGYDSDNPYNETFAPFMHVVNEMYARDLSKKIRSAFKIKMEEGSYIGNFAPYGYRKDPNNKNHLIVDYEVAPIVQEIFKMAEDGLRPSDIADNLNLKGIMTPAMYRCVKHPGLNVDNYSKRKEWTPSGICKLLRNPVYLGHTLQGKTSKISFKSQTSLTRDKEDWYVVKNTHTPLISQETYDSVRKRSVARRNNPKTQFKNIFSGIAKCADCGRNMSTTGTRKKGSIYNLVCGGYKLYGGKECTNHFIDYNTLYQIVLQELQEKIALTAKEKNEIVHSIKTMIQNSDEYIEIKKTISSLESRFRELDKIAKRLYEDHYNGQISDERFSRMMKSYDAEQNDISHKIEMLSKNLKTSPEQESWEKYFELLDEFASLPELNRDVLLKLVDKIEIGQGHFEVGEDGQSHKQQEVKIYYKFIGSL